jgi:hypothetical protein
MQNNNNNNNNNRARDSSPGAKIRIEQLLERATIGTQEALRDAFRKPNRIAKIMTIREFAKEKRAKQIAEMKKFSAKLKMPKLKDEDPLNNLDFNAI